MTSLTAAVIDAMTYDFQLASDEFDKIKLSIEEGLDAVNQIYLNHPKLPRQCSNNSCRSVTTEYANLYPGIVTCFKCIDNGVKEYKRNRIADTLPKCK